MTLSYLRAILITDPIATLATAAFGTLGIIVSLSDPTGDRQMLVARMWARSVCWICGIRVQVEGLEKLDGLGHCILSPNHLSYMDTPVVLAGIPLNFRFMAKQELFKVPFLGAHLQHAGHISVPLEDPRASIRSLAHAARVVNERQLSILVFPEGGRSENGELQDFKEGAAYLAIKAGRPIVPIALCGTRAILPMHSLHVRGGIVRVRIGDPILTSALNTHDRGQVTSNLRNQIATLLESTPVGTHV